MTEVKSGAWDMVSLAQLQEFARRDDCLDIMVPSDLRHMVGRYSEAMEALRTAKETIRAWHGPTAWDIYDRASPEMKSINAALAKAEGGQTHPVFDPHNDGDEVMFPGLSLRDWFAGQALAGHLASYAHPNSAGTSQDTPEKQAAWAYGFADAMIAERSK